MDRIRAPALALALLVPASLAAAPAGEVERVQMPAWRERGASVDAVRPGLALEPGDVVRTGHGARVHLRLAEGSLVKLGADARFELRALEPPASPGGAFEGILEVVKGAFRFTTGLLSRRHRRSLDVRVAGVTAGIRGTDVWGKAAPDRDIVCLIEGEITVSRGEDAPITMSDPLSFYVAPKDQPPLPVRPVDPEQLERWASQTELDPDAPALEVDGGWLVYLSSLSAPETAARTRAMLEQRGYPAEVRRALVGGTTRYRVAVAGFSGPEAARAFAAQAAALGYPGAWVAGG